MKTAPTTNPTREEVAGYITNKIERLSRDWDIDEPVTPESKMFGELGMESLDAVVLAASIQEHYGRQMPFAELFAEIGEKQCDLRVNELADFVFRNVAGAQAGAQGKL